MGTIGSRLKQIRESVRLDQEAFATELGVSRNTLSRWERDQGTPSAKALEMVREKYSINVEWLLFGDGDMKSWPRWVKVDISNTAAGVGIEVKGKGLLQRTNRAYDAIHFALSKAAGMMNYLGVRPDPDRTSLIYQYLVELLSEFDRHELRIINGVLSEWTFEATPHPKPESNQD